MQKTPSSPSLVKIRTSFAQIIVHKIKEKPYFEILYFDSKDKCFHIGFGSFYLEYVFQWLAEEFEIIEGALEIDYRRFQFVKGQLLHLTASVPPYCCNYGCGISEYVFYW